MKGGTPTPRRQARRHTQSPASLFEMIQLTFWIVLVLTLLLLFVLPEIVFTIFPWLR